MLSAIGDMHLERLENYIPDAYKSILSTFDKVVDQEVENGTSAIVQLGDIFNKAYVAKEYEIALIKSLYRHPKVPKYILIGNHDFDDVNNYALKLIRYLFNIGFINGKVFYKPEILSIDDEKYLFCSHPHVVNEPPKGTKFCFGHFGYEGARGDNGYVIKSGNSPKGRWVLGDYHTQQRGKNYIYPGSLTQINFHESPEKYIVRIDETVKTVKINPNIRLGRTTIGSEDDLEALDKNIYWSVNISSKAKLPPNWATKNPHIVVHHLDKSDRETKRQRILMKKVASENPLEGFDDYLRDEGLEEKQIIRINQLLGI